MNFNQLISGNFKKRLNRFVVEIELEDKSLVLAHLANTGRMKELLIPNCMVLLKKAINPNRKTAYDLLFVKNRNNKWIMLKASYANDLFFSWLNQKLIPEFQEVSHIKKEVNIGSSRFDFSFESGQDRWLIEVKSVNYFFSDYAVFPDAPTKRGAKHINDLIILKNQGYKVAIIFILMGENAKNLYFNDYTDPEFVQTINSALSNNILIKAYQSDFNGVFPFYSQSQVRIGGLDGNLCVSRI